MEHYNLTNGIVKLFLLRKQIVLVTNNLWLYGVCREVVNEVPIKIRRMEIKILTTANEIVNTGIVTAKSVAGICSPSTERTHRLSFLGGFLCPHFMVMLSLG